MQPLHFPRISEAGGMKVVRSSFGTLARTGFVPYARLWQSPTNTMKTYPDIPTLADATSVADALPGRHGLAVNRRTGSVSTLAGRRVR